MSLQCDSLLLDATLVAIPLARSEPLRARLSGRGPSTPHALWVFAPTFLNLRLVFASGVVKLASGDPVWRELRALDFHYWTQPLPGPLSHWVHQLPGWVDHASCAGVFALELVAPWLLLAPLALGGVRLRRVGVVALVSLQLLIMATGNYGFFNLLSIVLCLPAVDDAWWQAAFKRFGRSPPEPRGQVPPERSTRFGARCITAGAGLLILLNAVPLGATLFGWGLYPDSVRRAWSATRPLHIASSYGLFARMTTTRTEPVFEGTRDGSTWEPYVFRYKPGDPSERPTQSAPHMPRLDWSVWFAALGSSSHLDVAEALRECLRDAEPDVLDLLRHDPFHGERPREVRMRSVRYEFTERSGPPYWRIEADPTGAHDE